MEDTDVSSSNSLGFIQDCSKDQQPGEVNYETYLPDLGDSTSQNVLYNFSISSTHLQNCNK